MFHVGLHVCNIIYYVNQAYYAATLIKSINQIMVYGLTLCCIVSRVKSLFLIRCNVSNTLCKCECILYPVTTLYKENHFMLILCPSNHTRFDMSAAETYSPIFMPAIFKFPNFYWWPPALIKFSL